MKKIILFLFAFLFFISFAYAFDSSKVNYPVAELGNCASEQACAEYCDNPNNMEVCLNYAEKTGMMTQAEIDEARKVMPFLKAGTTPGGCKGQKECDAYCEDDSHINECIDFAVKAGFIDAKEAEMIKKTGGKGPGGCKKNECKTYCDKEENFPTCIEFALANGMISKEEYEMAKKTGGKGPGNCKGKEVCDAYCKEHELECMKFGMEHGMAPDMGEEGKCMMECMVRLNVVCKPGPSESQPSGCEQCGEECSKYYKGPCLMKADFEEKRKECEAKNMGMKPIMGDSGQEGRGECAVSIECIENPKPDGDYMPRNDSSMPYDPSKGGPAPEDRPGNCNDCISKCQPPAGQVLRGTDCVDNECKCFFISEEEFHPPQQGQEGQGGNDGGGYSGGCTSPGPNGECNPGSGAGEGQQGGGSESSSGGGGSSGGGESSSGGEGAGVTGQAILDTGKGIISKIVEFLKEVFS